MEVGFVSTVPASKHCGKSLLEALPQDVLIRIVCRVDHDDLRALFHVSKTVHEATLVAKKLHFEYSTPKKTVFLRKNIDLQGDHFGEFNEVVAPPNAPRHSRVAGSRFFNTKKLADISVALFTSDDDDALKWQRSRQFLQMAATAPVYLLN